MRSSFSKTTVSWPARLICWAAARPAGPEPMTATRLPVRVAGRMGSTQPSLEGPFGDLVLDVLDVHRRDR